MKFYYSKIAAVMAGLLTFISCVEEPAAPETMVPEGVPSFTATVEGADTKTVLDGRISKWSGEESIQVIGRNGSYKFSASVTGTSTKAVFSFDGKGEYDETEVMAVYPYGSGSYGADLENRTVSSVVIPSVQTAVAGSYDPAAAVAVAYTSGSALNFKNAVALLKFTMGSDNVKNVTVWGEMSEVEVDSDINPADNIYLTIPEEWKSDNAWFAAYFWNNAGYKSVRMSAVSGNLYSCAKPSGYSNVLFCRMNPAYTEFGWNNDAEQRVWNQTVDLTLSEDNHFTITKPWGGQEDKAEGAWATSTFTSTTLGISGAGTVRYNDGDPQVSGFSTGYVSLNGDFVKGETYYMAVAPVVFEKGFTVQFSNSGDYDKYDVKGTSKKVKFERNIIYDLGTISSDIGFYTEPDSPDADEPMTIYYRPGPSDNLYSHTGDLYAHVWLPDVSGSYGSTWGDNSDKYKLSKVSGEKLWKMEMTPTIREWFASGTNPLERIGILARKASVTDSGKDQSDDYFINVTDGRYAVDIPSVPMPAGLKHGINYVDGSTVTLVLYDRDKNGRSHDFCNLLWDGNRWAPANDKRYPPLPMKWDNDKGCWWVTLSDLDPDKQYKFQYQLGYGENVTVTTFDPYTEIVYDTSNDQYIKDSAYPDLATEYGSSYGSGSSRRDVGFISAFKINWDEYDWEIEDYQIADGNDLVIYELLLRDFTDNSYGEGNIPPAMEYLDYLEGLGVNAIELMPVQEFDGNNSWGYGNHAYFALDKAYGTRAMYKQFIDECHKRGMAVILDVVYNHATGAHPYAAMYWNGDKPASNNPWFNVDAPHGWSVYHDWNHSNKMVREHVKRSLEYLITEYKVDGFRFDLTKGFTQTSGESYDQNRVDWLKEYNAHIKSVDPNAVMICEHFVDDENWELGKDGIKVWRNMNHSYTKAMRRNMSDADFTGTTNTFNDSGMMGDWQTFGQYVGYQESHDEERICYLGQWEDNNGPEIPFATRMERAKINAAFFLLSPGPKMIWQFGEIGYDHSIEDGGRTDKKPWKTEEYMAVKERKALYDTYAMLIKFRKDNPRFFDSDVNFRWYVGGSQKTGRYLFAKSGDNKHFALFGNFGTGSQNISVSLPKDGIWYQYDNGAEWKGSSHNTKMAEGQFVILVDDKNACLK